MNSILKHLLIFACFAFCNNSNIWSQNLFIPEATIDYSDGLIDENVTCFAKDAKGFLWLGTSNGLLRYNGSKFQIWTTADSLYSNWILSLKADKNRLWIGTANGLNYMDIQTNAIFKTDDQVNEFKLSKEWITGMIKDDHENIWVFNNGLLKMNYDMDSMAYFNHSFGNLANIITQVLIDNQDNSILWCATANGLTSFDTKKKIFDRHYTFSHADTSYANRINLLELALFQDKNRKLYGCSLNGGMLLVNPNSGEISAFNQQFKGIDFSNVKFKQIVNYDDQHLLMFCNLGLILFNVDLEKIVNFFPTKAFKKNSFANSWRDSLNRLWINSDKGLSIYNFEKPVFEIFDFPEEQFDLPTRISKVIEDEERSVLYLLEQQGNVVFQFDRKTNEFLSPLSKFNLTKQPENIKLITQDLLVTSDNRLLLLTENRLWEWTGLNWKDTNILTDLDLEPYTSIAETIDGKLVITSNYEGIFIYSNAEKQLQRIPKTQLLGDGNWALNVFPTKENEFWIFQNGRGMSLWDEPSNRKSGISFMTDQFDHLIVGDFQQLDKERFLIAAGRLGIYDGSFSRNDLNKVEIEDDFFNYSFFEIEEDESGNLWSLTQDGLLKSDNEYSSYTYYKYPNHSFDITSGSNQNLALTLLSDGMMAFASTQSLCFFNPENLKTNKENSTPLISSVIVNNSPIDLLQSSQDFNFNHTENNIQFNLSLINYNALSD